jgi:hypothetical protein
LRNNQTKPTNQQAMKNSILINVSTARADGRENSVESISLALRGKGFRILSSRIVRGEWEGKPEISLALELLAALPLCHLECLLATRIAIQRLSEELGQDCIAVEWPNGHGELVPEQRGVKFQEEFFHKPFPDLSRQTGAESVAW